MKAFFFQLLSVLTLTGLILTCSEQQKEINGHCCNRCPAGEYLVSVCSKTNQTICNKCPSGTYSDSPTLFDRCEKCSSCEHEYGQKCTPTTNAICSCGIGFLCSDKLCSSCEKVKCSRWEKPKTTDVSTNDKFKYECEPICLDHQYYDEKKNICMPITQCSAHGLDEVFAGNKTHDAICQSQDMQKIFMVVIAGFVLVLITIIAVLSYHLAKCIKKIKHCKPLMVTTTEVCPLSMEETATPENKL
ncbi:tumor necrosis factor receptor superfamily member 18 isoform X2 [Boleophthalmus pectinirostris]|uniref:tumor necrosis factor receptor superfamily member 18 isoform X2 n=1 Tax=Boleophthalmus pectinirostris TaxID=150288 RepID=UPI00243303FD|nr:tumor necrosis factor receptor superfamily member 18 isoform X2 [Boleophthalmus pectinirostris]